jgi:hypothetical protein
MQPDNQEGQQIPPITHVPKEGKSPRLLKYVIILIILAVILATIFFIFISPEEEDTENLTHGFVWKKNPENPGNYIGYYKGIESTLDLYDFTISASHGGSSNSMDLDVLAGESQLIVGDMTLDFIDLEPFGKFGSNDIFMVYGGKTGDPIRIVYVPTCGSVPSSSLP